MNHFFAYINRMRFIQRWSLMRNSYTENIQEHSHQTAVLAHALAVLRNERFGGQVDVGAVAVAALYHDAGEILTGDMPTPIKYYNPGIREAYKAVEQVAEDKLLSMLPEDLRPAYEDALRPADPEIEQLVRAADKLSAHIKCIEELCRISLKNGSRNSSIPNCWRLYRSTTDSFTLKSSVILPILKPVRSPPPT